MMIAGQTLGGRYQIIELLGKGGFGETYLAKDTHLPGHPLRAVKRLQTQCSDPLLFQTASRLFDTEAETLYKLGERDGIPQLFAHFQENQEFYLVQEYIEGHDLTKEIIPGKQLSETEVTELLRGILEVLEFVHRHDVIHRDIKPANLIRRAKDGKIAIVDFGSVKQISSQINPQGKSSRTVAVGTEGYMPPEQLKGQPLFCSDIYAVGMVGIQALTGIMPAQLPSDPNTLEVIWRDCVSVSPRLAAILDKMAHYNFRYRYPSASEALADINATVTSPAHPTVPVPAPPPPKTPKFLWLAVTGLGIAALAGTVLLKFIPQSNLSPPQPNPKPSPTRESVW